MSVKNELNIFSTQVKTFSRGYQFSLELALPPGLSTKTDYQKYTKEEYITMFCESMTLPQRTYDTTDLTIQHGRPQIRVAGQVRYTAWSLQFRSEAGLSLRNLFLDWQETISTSVKTQMDYNAPKNYKSNGCKAKIKLKPASGKDPAGYGAIYTFYGLYPSDVSGITLSHSDTSIVTFGVEFTYDFYNVEIKKAKQDKNDEDSTEKK